MEDPLWFQAIPFGVPILLNGIVVWYCYRRRKVAREGSEKPLQPVG